MAVGDVMLARRIDAIVADDPDRVFAGVATTFAGAELVVGNLECAISARGQPHPVKRFRFRARPAAARVLERAGFDVMSLANNHAGDYGTVALLDTIDRLSRRRIGPVGAGRDDEAAYRSFIVARDGLRIAFLGFLADIADRSGWRAEQWAAGPGTPGVALAKRRLITRAVAAAREVADVVVVMLHAGREGSHETIPSQRAQAETAIAAGASLVLGAHAHVLQPAVRGERTLIAYGLGNFVFDGFTGASNDSVILDVTLTPDGVTDVRWIPVVVRGGVPRLAGPAASARILARLQPPAGGEREADREASSPRSVGIRIAA